MASPHSPARAADPAGDFATPEGPAGLLARLFSEQALPAGAARIGAKLAAWRGKAWRVGSNVIVARHEDVREVLDRDLDFRIAPVNAGRIDEVNGPFVLGMDRGAVLDQERAALYHALAGVDLASLQREVEAEAECLTADAAGIDAVAAYARPIAAHTAQRLFGVTGTDQHLFEDMTRAVFAHTFLNISGDEKVRQRALRASKLMHRWLSDEIARRTEGDVWEAANDMMSVLLRDGMLDHDGIRRTLGGMLVGSVDTTASAVAKIVSVIARDPALLRSVAADVDNPVRLRGWCWEALRRWPHNPILLRQAAVATTIAGIEVRAGDRIIVWTQAAMQDARAFPRPKLLEPDRPTDRYLHFGATLHACAGRAVNAFQIPALVAALVRRGLRSVGKVGWAGPFPAHLQVDFK